MEQTLTAWKELLKKEAILWDNKQSSKKGYNMFALGLYFENITEAIEDPKFLEDPKAALARRFIIRGERGGIYHRNLPKDLTNEKFTLPFINSALKKGLIQKMLKNYAEGLCQKMDI